MAIRFLRSLGVVLGLTAAGVGVVASASEGDSSTKSTAPPAPLYSPWTPPGQSEASHPGDDARCHPVCPRFAPGPLPRRIRFAAARPWRTSL